jgi:hypothetical protein
MTDSRIARFLADASSGQLNRRQVIERGLALGVATPVLADRKTHV